jgi:hypothetical protein
VLDFFSIPNALSNGAFAASYVSYDVEWSGVMERSQVRDDVVGFAGLFLTTSTTINWSACHDDLGFTFASDATGRTTKIAAVAHERNGVFFP